MAGLDDALVRCGQLSERIGESDGYPCWLIARRRAAAIALAHADFEWEVDLEDLNRLFLLRQAGLVGQVWKVRRHTKEVIGYIHRQRDVAMPSMRDIGGRSGLMEGDPNSPGQAAMWVRSTYDLAATFRRSKGSFQAFIETVWKVSQQEVLRSCIMVAVAMALRRRWKFRREMPGLWGTTPNEHESRARFEGRFLAALERQAEEGIKEAAEIDRRNREAKRRIASSAREGSSALEAWSMLLARRVISPALLASDVGLSVRGASLVLERLVGLGLAVEVVERRAYRRFVAADDHEALSILANHSRRPGGSKSPGHALPGANSGSDGVLLANGDDAPPGRVDGGGPGRSTKLVLDPPSVRIPDDVDSDLAREAEEAWEAMLVAADSVNDRVARLMKDLKAKRRGLS